METISLNKYRQNYEKEKRINYDILPYSRIWDILDNSVVSPEQLVRKWIYSRIPRCKEFPDSFQESYTTLVPIDQESLSNPRLYQKLYNPVVLKITTNGPGQPLLFSAMCMSCGNWAFGTINKTTSNYIELCSIRDKFIEYLENTEYLSIKDFIDLGIKLGGFNASW